MIPVRLRAATLFSALFIATAVSAAEPRKIVLIGGAASEGPGRHDYPRAVRVLDQLLGSSPDLQGLDVQAYPDGWPNDSALEGASTLVLYFDGLDRHPLLVPERRARFEKLMKSGVGLVVLHQATTVPPADRTLDLQRWVGGTRFGMFDRATEMAEITPAAPEHPVSSGVAAFTYLDEFYPTIHWQRSEALRPILKARLHVESREGKDLVIRDPIMSTVAWVYERTDGGRAFGYTGAHYLAALDQPSVRRLLLNAIAWTARIDVPADGVRSLHPGAAAQAAKQGAPKKVVDAVVTRAAENQVIDQTWGKLTWYVSAQLGNSDTMTVGEAVIRPGQENPRHYHPNCDEVLRVVRGRILHSMGSRQEEMSAGDTVSIPTGMRHNARNIGTEDAVLAISFSSAHREVIGE